MNLLNTKAIIYISILLICNPVQTSNAEPDILSPSISSEAAVVIDACTGNIIYAKNEHEKNYPASITKLMTALLGFEEIGTKDNLSFSKEAVMSIEYGSSHIGITEDEILTSDQAFHALLLMSANEVANGIAENSSGSIESFIESMNNKARQLGANNTHFVNPHGLHEESHYTTAYDMSIITRELLKMPEFLEIMEDITYQIPITNKSEEIRYLSQQHKMMNVKRDSSLYRKDVIAGKTGYTNQAGHTLVTVARQEDKTIIVVLLKSNAESMYKDTSMLLDYGFENIYINNMINFFEPNNMNIFSVSNPFKLSNNTELSKPHSNNIVTAFIILGSIILFLIFIIIILLIAKKIKRRKKNHYTNYINKKRSKNTKSKS